MSLSKDRFKPIKDLSEFNKKNAAKSLADAISKKLKAQNRLIDLISFRKEYEDTQKTKSGLETVSASVMNDQRIFVDKITQAISDQQKILKVLTSDLDEQIQLWRKSDIYDQSVDTIINRYQAHEYSLEKKREQQESDESAQRVFMSSHP